MRYTTLSLWLLLAALVSSRALAQEGGEKLKLGAAMVIDFGGSIEYDPPGRANSDRSDARVTPGLRLHADYDIHRHLSVGGLFRMGFWRSDERDESRNMLIDLAGRLNAHYDWHDLRFYGVLMLGPSFNRLHSGNLNGLDNPGVGVAAAIAPGIEWWFSRRFALFSEIFGWTGHFMHHDYQGASGSMDLRINQVLWQIGMLTGL